MALYESKLLGNESGELSLDLGYSNDRFGGYNAAYGETLWKETYVDYPDQTDPMTGIPYHSWPDFSNQQSVEPIGATTINLSALKSPYKIQNKSNALLNNIPFVKKNGIFTYVSLYDWFALVCIDKYAEMAQDETIISPIVSGMAFGTSSGPIVGVTNGSNNYAREVNGLSDYYDQYFGLLFRVNPLSPLVLDGYTGEWIFKGNLIPLNKHNLWINFPALDYGLYEKVGTTSYQLTADVTCQDGKTYYKDSAGTIEVTEDSLFNDLQTNSLGVFYDYASSQYSSQVGVVWKQNPSIETASDDILHDLSQYEEDPSSWYVLDNMHRYFSYISQIKFSTAYKLNAAATSTQYVLPLAVIGVYGKGFSLRS